jgi:riboflavin transporter FmnP
MLAFIGGAVKSGKQGEYGVQISISIRCLIKHLSFLNIITFDFPFYSILSDSNTIVPVGILYHVFGAHACVCVCVCMHVRVYVMIFNRWFCP